MPYIKMIAVIFILLLSFSLHSQSVKIGSIDIYGNRNISSETILQSANISEGDSISRVLLLNKVIEKNIGKIAGIKLAKTALICCDEHGNYHLFIGVAESDSTILFLREAPKLRIILPEKYTNAYKQFHERLSDAIQAGKADEDWSNGHSLIHYPPARKIQEKYGYWAEKDFAMLSKVLRSSAYAEQRATAAQIIAYHPDKTKALPELMHAIIDESDEVRNIVTRAIAVIAYYSTEHPEKKINIPYLPFIRLINSVVWSDRTKGLSVLLQLTKARDTVLLNKLKEISLPALKEMAVWKSKTHAMPAYIILGRISGIPEDQIFKSAAGTNFADEAMKLTNSIK